MSQFSHFDDEGGGRMIDVGAKEVTLRRARAAAYVTMQPETLSLIQQHKLKKGDVFEVARLAGIMAGKRTSELVPLCHPLPLDSLEIDIQPVSDCRVRIEASASVHARTGVEMEVLTAASIAALTIYDMCKSVDRGITIGPVGLVEKSGGKSGHFQQDL